MSVNTQKSYNCKIITTLNNVEVKKYKRNIHVMSDFEKMLKRRERERIKEMNAGLPEVKFVMSDSDKAHSLAVSTARTKQKVYGIVKANEWEMFVTFTFNPKLVKRTDYSDVTKKMHHWLTLVKKAFAPDLKYIIVPELHEDKKAFHFHGLFANTGNLDFIFSGIVKKGKKLYNLEQFNLGWSTCSIVEDTTRVSGYITKYITKELCLVSKNKKRYWHSKNCNVPCEETLTIPEEDVETLIDSFGFCSYAKTIDIPQQYNSCKIFQINT